MMAKAQSKIQMVGGRTYSLEITPEEVDAEIVNVLGGESNGVVDGWRFICVKDYRGDSLRLNIDHIEAIEETRTGKATFS
ncbi:MAG TPA: hypothetical protein P5138_01735 [Solirubrobacterales bacterium]|nr:hypothetical protein [Solirubrobacterales bacterium]